MDLFDTLAAVTTNTPPRRVFSLCWNLSFRGPQSTVSMGFSRAPIEKIPSSLNEGRRLTRIISNDDSLFNYFIKIKDYIVKRTKSLVAETFSIAYVKVFRLFIYLIVENTWAVDDELPTRINSKKRRISHRHPPPPLLPSPQQRFTFFINQRLKTKWSRNIVLFLFTDCVVKSCKIGHKPDLPFPQNVL